MIQEYTLNGKTLLGIEVSEDAYDFRVINPHPVNTPSLNFNLKPDSWFGKIDLPSGQWELLGRARELTEEAWRGLVESQEEPKPFKEIELSQGEKSLVDESDYESLLFRSWSVDKRPNKIYAKATLNGKKILMHRFLLGITNPEIQIDHRNHNGLDNRRNNLRLSTNLQNSMNRRSNKNSTSKYKGVSWNTNKRKWRVEIKINTGSVQLGEFISEIEAAMCYDRAAKLHFGEYAYLNLPSTESGLSFCKANNIGENILLILKTN